MKKKRICFVAPNAYPLLQNESSFHFMGGAELQQVLLGRHLQKEGYEVSFVTRRWDGNGSDESLEGIRVFKTFSREDGLPGLRFFYPRLYKTWKALKRADADIYYQRGATSLTGIVALFCRIRKKSFFFSGAHDSNFMVPSIDVPRFLDRKLFAWGLKNTSRIFVQSRKQKDLLFENFGLTGLRVHNVYPRRDLTADDKYVLWVSNIKRIKRPLLFIEIAKKFPGRQFVMIGGPVRNETGLFERVAVEAASVGNIEFLGFRSFEETESYFNGASLFINTAEMEGFPNTFLQAWSRGIPTISFVDIDDIISNNALGAVVGNEAEVELHLGNLVNLPTEKRERIRKYFIENHAPEIYIKMLEDSINECLEIGSDDGLLALTKTSSNK